MPARKPTPHDERTAHPGRQDASGEAWPAGVTYTIYFPDGEGFRGADLEHPAPLPRIGDTLDYIDERGALHRYRVRDVIHTLQTSAATRPSVKEGPASPNALARTDAAAEPPGGGGTLRAGLPEVFLAPVDAEQQPRRPKRATRR